MAQKLKALGALAENLDSGGSQSSGTAVPGDLTPVLASQGSCILALHIYIPR